MSLLELITKAATSTPQLTVSESEYPIILNPDSIFSKLKPKGKNSDPKSLLCPVSGWEISETDMQLVDLNKKFSTKLSRKLKDTNGFTGDEFLGLLIGFLEKIGLRAGVSVGVGANGDGYVRVLVEKVGFLMGRGVVGLVLESCVRFEIWDLVETLVGARLVDRSFYSDLFPSLAAKKRSELLCACVKYAPDLGLVELRCILQYFLSPSKDTYGSMVSVRKEWESQALLAVEKASDKASSEKKSRAAKAASVLLMVAYDGFSTPELCLHYLLASPNIDEVIFASVIGKLGGQELMRLIRYLGKWLRKYEMFPEATPCRKASSMLGLKVCDWVPKLEDIVRCLALVLDENFSSLVLHSEFHDELISLVHLAGSLASEAKICSMVTSFIENLRTEAPLEQS